MNFVSREFVSGNIKIRGKQNSLFSKGPVIKSMLPAHGIWRETVSLLDVM